MKNLDYIYTFLKLISTKNYFYHHYLFWEKLSSEHVVLFFKICGVQTQKPFWFKRQLMVCLLYIKEIDSIMIWNFLDYCSTASQYVVKLYEIWLILLT